MNRKFDIDWVRVIAIALLLIYHVAICFQQWAPMIAFISNRTPLPSLWIPMAMLNIWRIPLLFFVSGMGVFFAMQNRTLKQLIVERSLRIFVPLVFGSFAIVPLHLFLWQNYYNLELSYTPDVGHLWFLGNIFAYVLILAPVFYILHRSRDGRVAQAIRKVFGSPWGLLVAATAFVLEVLLVEPIPYELYARTWHGFWLGLIAFFFGFCFVFSGQKFFDMLVTWRWGLVTVAVILFGIRITLNNAVPLPNPRIALESQLWILSVFAFASIYLNRPGKTLHYLSGAAYPVYIIHMVFLYLGCSLLFPLNIHAMWQFVLLVAFTFTGSLAFYEFVVRRSRVIGLLFGSKPRSGSKPSMQRLESSSG